MHECETFLDSGRSWGTGGFLWVGLPDYVPNLYSGVDLRCCAWEGVFGKSMQNGKGVRGDILIQTNLDEVCVGIKARCQL